MEINRQLVISTKLKNRPWVHYDYDNVHLVLRGNGKSCLPPYNAMMPPGVHIHGGM